MSQPTIEKRRTGLPPALSINAAYLIAFALALALLLYRSAKKPEQDWYKARALAESVKTSTRLYVMRAKPFDGDDQMASRRPRGRFRWGTRRS